MDLISVIISVIIAAAAVLAVVHMWKNRGRSCCGCSRTDCPAHPSTGKASSARKTKKC